MNGSLHWQFKYLTVRPERVEGGRRFFLTTAEHVEIFDLKLSAPSVPRR
jgi:hypothetical protein